MENGDGDLESRFSGLGMNDHRNINGNDGLFQVVKAVEAAEATIKQQKLGDPRYQNSQSGDQWVEHVDESNRTDQTISGSHNKMSETRTVDINSGLDLSNSALQEELNQNYMDQPRHTHMENHFDNGMVNGSSKHVGGGEIASDYSSASQFVSPSNTPFSPIRYQLEGSSDSQLKISGHGLISMGENINSQKQDLVPQVQEHEEEILQLKKHLAEYSIKETQIRNETYVLEKRISYMRMAFDQQQQELVDAASKSISYRQDIMEDNVRLTYALQAAQLERSMFVSSLMPLLAEYSLQPPVADAQSIVGNIKVLFRHLREQLLVTEGKLKESQYQLAPWRSVVNPSNLSQSQFHPVEMNNGLELVQQPTFSNGNMPSSGAQTTLDEDLLGRPQSGLNDAVKNSEHDELGRYPHFANRSATSQEVPAQFAINWADSNLVRNNEETVSKKVTFGDLVRSRDVDEPDIQGNQSDREPSVNWTSKASAYTTTLDDPNSSYSPFLAPVLEEPSSSFSDAADDDPLPAIEGLQISGDAYPAQQLRASGYSINGTTSCNFGWLRHMEDGSFNYIDGAKQPDYLVSADDVDTYLAIEVQPLDDRKLKGELVKVFANEHRKITLDQEMHTCIEKTLYGGHASYKLSLSTGYLDIWEPATLTIKRDGYCIKCSGGDVINEKFSSSTIVSIPSGSVTEFSIIDSSRTEHLLKAENSSTDVSGWRDTIVLTLRLFIVKANEKKKGKKKGLFFNK